MKEDLALIEKRESLRGYLSAQKSQRSPINWLVLMGTAFYLGYSVALWAVL
jgi:hypothetical protein